MDNTLKFFFAAFVGWLWMSAAGVMGSSLTSFFHFFSFTAIDGFISFLTYVMTFIGWLAVVFFGWLTIRNAWKSK
ncbi:MULTISPECIES: hypothetical protein [Bacillaceae]|uniref:hypothetical protein n=1 Tax=Bacillaceae TaxID=186817 RepID=UPI00101D9260|nr:hypothetical protein [Ectobacillus funiculus]